jgi:hypothetical protein
MRRRHDDRKSRCVTSFPNASIVPLVPAGRRVNGSCCACSRQVWHLFPCRSSDTGIRSRRWSDRYGEPS